VKKPKILLLDIETAPAEVYVFALRDQNIGIDQIKTPVRILCWSAKWHKEKGIEFDAEWKHGDNSVMLIHLHAMLSEADAVITYNGDGFDLPKINGEFLQYGLPPAPPIPSIDLYKTTKKMGYISAKLAWVAPHLGIGEKVKNAGIKLWKDVLDGDERAQAKMESYNKQDTRLLGALYERLKPYIKNHPYLGTPKRTQCSKCGSSHLQSRGERRTKAFIVKRFQCQACGGWDDGPKTKVPGKVLNAKDKT
jgi:RNase_H superfamily